ncbi:MAG: phosphoribosylanthranilate isomerase [Alphaproteobacteria bacterium]|nr:phosphoribosylanthranilate isomerase [Alphaproteobacteria bacterium]
MGVLVKICGITSVEAADAAARAGADFVGLVFHKKSPRNLELDQACALAARLRGRTRLVALFAAASDDEMDMAVKAVEPDFVQLHGGELPGRVADVRARFGVPVIKAFAVADASDLAEVASHDAEMFLFDAKGERAGGNGAAFDWQLLRGRTFARPWLLAGGLSADNVARAIQVSGAPGVDVSSGVETAPGLKSAEMIVKFVSEARL